MEQQHAPAQETATAAPAEQLAPGSPSIGGTASAMGNASFALLAREISGSRAAPFTASAGAPPGLGLSRGGGQRTVLSRPSAGDPVLARAPTKDAAEVRKHIPALEKTAAAARAAAGTKRSTAQKTLGIADDIAKSFSTMTGEFHNAYTAYKTALQAAEQQAAEENELIQIAMGVTIAVFVGLTAAPVIELVVAQKVVVEASAELAEVGLGKLSPLEAPPPASTPPAGAPAPGAGKGGDNPPSLTPEAMALEQSQKLVEIYKAGLQLQAGADPGTIADACQQVLTDIERHQRSANKWSGEKIAGFVTALTAKEPQIKAFEEKCAAAITALEAQKVEASLAVAFQPAAEIEHDLWIRWISENRNTLESWYYGRKIKAHLMKLGLIDDYLRLSETDTTDKDPAQVMKARALRGQVGIAAGEICKGARGTVNVSGDDWQATSVNDVPAGGGVVVTGVVQHEPRHASWQPSFKRSPTLIVQGIPKPEEPNYTPDEPRQSTIPPGYDPAPSPVPADEPAEEPAGVP